MPADEVTTAVRECEKRAQDEGIVGNRITPFLLSCLAERTNGRSIEANLVLLESNARVAAEIAVELARGA